MLKQLITYTAVFGLALFAYQSNAAEVTPYGSINYKWSNDENAAGKSYHKLEDNGSSLGVDFSDIMLEGDTLAGFGKIEVGVDTDDAGSNTFDSKLAYAGIEGTMGSLSVGRQSHPFTDNIGGKTSIFNVYGSNADWNYASRSSQTLAISTTVGPLSIDSLGIVDGSSSNTDAFDQYEYTASMNIMDSDISFGYADDVNNDISYWGVAGSSDLGIISMSSSYTIYDAATDKYGLEVTASYDIFSIGYGDKEGTGHYYTGGVAHGLTDSLTVYAEGEMADLDSGVETTSWSVGSKFTF
tara:strand:- start:100 stop:990 length:891 start_codon:yes stop_codon:yes gene_type:complete